MQGIALFIKRSSFVFAVLAAALSILSFKLYRSNRIYQQYNRSLVVQNDSILSVNIQLINALENQKGAAVSQANNRASKKK